MTHGDLTVRAFHSLKTFLTGKKSSTHPSALQLQILHALMDNLSCLAYGEMVGRYAWPLPMGCGKTQSIQHWAATVAKCRLPFGVAIACNQVSALNDINEFLVRELHVPQSKIGTLVGMSKAAEVDGRYVLDGNDSQILLMTHARVHRGADELSRYWTYQGQARRVLCFDESLITAQSRIVSSKAIQRSVDLLKGEVERREISLSNDFLSAVLYRYTSFVSEMSDLKFQVHDYQMKHWDISKPEGPGPTVPDELRYRNIRLDAIDADRFSTDIETVHGRDWSKPLMAFFDLCGSVMRLVVTAHGEESMVSYTVTVPSEIDRMVILDASNPIRLLTQMDKEEIIKAESLPLVRATGVTNLATLFDYSNLTIHRYNAGGGRVSFENDTNDTRIKDTVGLLKSIPNGDGVLFFVFKGLEEHEETPTFQGAMKGLRPKHKKKKDIKKLLEQELDKAGYDLTSRYICIETFGRETSSNDYCHCQHVVFVGTPWQNVTAIIAIALGQVRDIKRHLEDQLVQDLYDSEAAYRLHQAIGRGCIRVVGSDGKPTPMKAYMFLNDAQWARIGPLLKTVLPGVKTPEAPLKKAAQKDRKVDEVVQAIELVTNFYNIELRNGTKLSVRDLKGRLPKVFSKNHFTYALDRFLDAHPEWTREGRSIVYQPLAQAKVA